MACAYRGDHCGPNHISTDRTLPQVAFDFRDLVLEEPESDDPYAHFHALIESGLHNISWSKPAAARIRRA